MMSEKEHLTVASAPPSGYYRVLLYGQSGSVLYECMVPPCQSFQYVCPSHVDGLKVYGFQMLWMSD